MKILDFCFRDEKADNQELQYECLCQQAKQGYQFNDLTNDMLTSVWFAFFGCIGAMLNFFVAYLIYRHKELRAHPMPIFMAIAICDYSIFWNQVISHFMCSWRLPELANLTYPQWIHSDVDGVIALMRVSNFWQVFFV